MLAAYEDRQDHPIGEVLAPDAFNTFTEVLKGNLNELPKRTEALHGLLDSYVGLSGFSEN